MSRDFIFSVVLHVTIVAVLMLSPSLSFERDRSDFGEVIKVNVVSSLATVTPQEPIPEAETPTPVFEDEPDDIPINDPTTRPEAKIIKPEEKPKPKPPKTENKPQPKNSEPKESSESTSGADVDAPAGSPFSGVRVDNAAFNYPYWFTLAYNKIGQNFRIPFAIDGKVYCDVYFQVIKSGKVIEAKIVKESPLPGFDAACLAAIEDASPFPPLPREFLDEIIGVTVTFSNQ